MRHARSLLAVLVTLPICGQSFGRAANVVILMTDGLRRPEVFGGADALLLDRKAGGVADPATLRRQFWRESAEERRAALLPFFWSVVAREGQVYGDRASGSEARAATA